MFTLDRTAKRSVGLDLATKQADTSKNNSPIMQIDGIILNERDEPIEQQGAGEASHIRDELQDADAVELEREARVQRA